MNKEELANVLDKDEIVIWSGKPAPFKIMDKYYKTSFIRNYIISFVLFCIVLVWALTSTTVVRETALIIVALFCIPFVAIPLRIRSYTKYRDKCNFIITDRSVLVFISDSENLKVPLSNIEKIESVPQFEGTRSVRAGRAFGLPEKKNRNLALKLKVLEGEKNDSFLLYNLTNKDADTALELINKYRVVS